MGFLSSLGNVLKVVAVVAAVVAIGYLVAPTFMASIGEGLAAIGSSIAETVSSGFAALGDTAAAQTVAEAAAAETTAMESALGATMEAAPAATEAAAAAAPAASEAATTAVTGSTPAAQAAATETIPAAAAPSVPDVIPPQAPATGAADMTSVGNAGVNNPSAYVAPDSATQVASQQAQVGFGSGGGGGAGAFGVSGADNASSLAFGGDATGGGGMLSNAWNATRGFVKENPLVTAMGMKMVGSALEGDPLQKKMEFEQWLRNQNSQSVTGSYRPGYAGPQQPLTRTNGTPVFNRPGLLGQTGG